MYNFYVLLAIVVLFFGLVGFLFIKNFLSGPAGGYDEGTISINQSVFRVAVADTEARREQGLSGREPLLPDQGMYFIFPFAMKYSFWMKDMKFPIDIIWIYKNKIVSVQKEAPAPVAGTSTFSLPLYYPSSKADAVLEISAGLYDRLGFKEGDKVSFAKAE